MKKIVIFMRNDERGRQLAQYLGAFFPECEIHALPAAPSEDRVTARERKGGHGEKNKNTGRRGY
jgi:hypothetical protein